MKKMIIKISLLSIIGIIISGCTSAGPFVTNISSDGQGNLLIEKTYVKLNSFTGTISNEGGTTTRVRLK